VCDGDGIAVELAVLVDGAVGLVLVVGLVDVVVELDDVGLVEVDVDVDVLVDGAALPTLIVAIVVLAPAAGAQLMLRMKPESVVWFEVKLPALTSTVPAAAGAVSAWPVPSAFVTTPPLAGTETWGIVRSTERAVPPNVYAAAAVPLMVFTPRPRSWSAASLPVVTFAVIFGAGIAAPGATLVGTAAVIVTVHGSVKVRSRPWFVNWHL